MAVRRTPVLTVEVVDRNGEYFISYGSPGPNRCIGPIEQPITMVDALMLLTTELRLEGRNDFALRPV